MKKIEAIINPFKLDEVKAAAAGGAACQGLSVSRSRASAAQKVVIPSFIAAAPNTWSIPVQVKIEMVMPTTLFERRQRGDHRRGPRPTRSATGKIFVSDLGLRRSGYPQPGETGEDAL